MSIWGFHEIVLGIEILGTPLPNKKEKKKNAAVSPHVFFLKQFGPRFLANGEMSIYRSPSVEKYHGRRAGGGEGGTSLCGVRSYCARVTYLHVCNVPTRHPP